MRVRLDVCACVCMQAQSLGRLTRRFQAAVKASPEPNNDMQARRSSIGQRKVCLATSPMETGRLCCAAL